MKRDSTRDSRNHGNCLTDETLTDYLEGALDPAVKVASEAHLLACDDCRVKLAFYMRLLNEEVQPEEALAIRTIQEEWARTRDSRRIAGPNIHSRGRWKIASGGVAAAILLALGTRSAIDHISGPRSADEVIYLLLAESRPFEGRISGQPYQRFAATLGPSEPGTSYSLLASQMTRLSATAHEMGQFYLLQKDFSRAISYLEVAEQEPAATDGVHNDLGVAYMESRAPSNLQKAIVEFRHALRANERFAPAAFNLAVLYDRLGRTDDAELAWKQYLRIESDPKWLEEGRSKLEALTH